ncbi:MAG: DNA/RNA non-specific endonuclease [Prevotella sp.]|nr:DNA/RNA non-specific endonuclease [Prevotella sp.]
MKKIWLLTLAMTLLLAGCGQNRQTESQMTTFVGQNVKERATTTAGSVNVTSLDLLKQRVGRGVSEIMLARTGYVTSYNKQTRTPNWVAWNLTKEHTYGGNQRANERFEEDTSVPEPRATFQDFYNSRYDRGHMCPAGDNKWNQDAMTESFLMTNICPQNHGLNKEDWNNLEIQCRTWARRFGEVTIVCGPLFEDGENARLIGRNKVRVPTGFFKVVYRSSPEPHAVGFIFKNNGSPQPWKEQMVSVDEVEKRTGFNFFHMLPDNIEDTVEAEESLREW